MSTVSHKLITGVSLDGGDLGHETVANLTFLRKGNFDQNAVSLYDFSPSLFLSSTAPSPSPSLSLSLTLWLVPECFGASVEADFLMVDFSAICLRRHPN